MSRKFTKGRVAALIAGGLIATTGAIGVTVAHAATAFDGNAVATCVGGPGVHVTMTQYPAGVDQVNVLPFGYQVPSADLPLDVVEPVKEGSTVTVAFKNAAVDPGTLRTVDVTVKCATPSPSPSPSTTNVNLPSLASIGAVTVKDNAPDVVAKKDVTVNGTVIGSVAPVGSYAKNASGQMCITVHFTKDPAVTGFNVLTDYPGSVWEANPKGGADTTYCDKGGYEPAPSPSPSSSTTTPAPSPAPSTTGTSSPTKATSTSTSTATKTTSSTSTTKATTKSTATKTTSSTSTSTDGSTRGVSHKTGPGEEPLMVAPVWMSPALVAATLALLVAVAIGGVVYYKRQRAMIEQQG